MARKGNPISVRLDLNRSSDSSRFSKGDRESHRMGHSRGCKPDGTQLGFETVCKRKSYHFCLYLYYSFLFFWNFVRICLALYSMFKGVCSMLPDLDLNMPYIPPAPEIFTHPQAEAPNVHLMSDAEREEFHRQMKEMEIRLEQLRKANEYLRGKLREGQFKQFMQDIARAQARPEWRSWHLDFFD